MISVTIRSVFTCAEVRKYTWYSGVSAHIDDCILLPAEQELEVDNIYS